MERIRGLLIEDNPGDARLVKDMLAEEQGVFFDFEWTDSLAKGLKRLEAGGIDLVLLDLNLPDSRGFNTFLSAQAQAPGLPIVIMTGLDDETLAIRAVRKGAQDYLVKGQIDGRQLARAIRYAIARRIGEGRTFTAEELQQYDGKEGRPAYVAFGGKVYDVSGSRLWANGLHGGKHLAGNDLTLAMSGAPHEDRVLARFPIVGELAREKALAEKLAQRLEGTHLHPISVHFSIAFSMVVSLFAFLHLLTDRSSFETTSYYLLLAGGLTSPLAAASGFLSWKLTYAGKMTRTFAIKIILSAIFIVVIIAVLVWRVVSPDVLIDQTGISYLYLTLLASLVPLTGALGYYGGKIVYA